MPIFREAGADVLFIHAVSIPDFSCALLHPHIPPPSLPSSSPISDEMFRLRSRHPEMDHREAFKVAAKKVTNRLVVGAVFTRGFAACNSRFITSPYRRPMSKLPLPFEMGHGEALMVAGKKATDGRPWPQPPMGVRCTPFRPSLVRGRC